MSIEKNRRAYFRIDDEVYLHANKVDHNTVVDIEEHRENFRQSTMLSARFHKQREAMDPVLEAIKSRDADVANYCLMLSEQVDLLVDSLLPVSVFASNEPLQSVNISAVGLQFKSQIDCQVGDVLEIIYVLFPNRDYIPLLAEVVRCERDDITEDNKISVKYISIDEADRELVIQHVLLKQRQNLQKNRLTG
ncbi:MAG: PilZ domain-containing protein [Gammaproteobacteria bacterium]|nr:PilZ domain-containing protein [Gammaproteobacteria bacterium]